MNSLGSAEGIPCPAAHTISLQLCPAEQARQEGIFPRAAAELRPWVFVKIWGWPCAVPVTPKGRAVPQLHLSLDTVSTSSFQGLFAATLSEIVPDHLLDIKYCLPVPVLTTAFEDAPQCNSTRLLHSLLPFLSRVIKPQI